MYFLIDKGWKGIKHNKIKIHFRFETVHKEPNVAQSFTIGCAQAEYWGNSGLVYHVEVGEGRHGSPVDGPGLHRLDPQIVGEHQGKDGDSLDNGNIRLMNNSIIANKQLAMFNLGIFLGWYPAPVIVTDKAFFCMKLHWRTKQ